MTAIGGHHTRSDVTTDSWITPQSIIKALGPFDLDPCESIPQPWPCAENAYNIDTDGLLSPWNGRVWCNPPYGKKTAEWLSRMASHSNGVALIFARTETRMFFEHVWEQADALLFIEGRLTFHRPDGSKAKANSGGPSVLIAYGEKNAECLYDCSIEGHFVFVTSGNYR